MAPTPGTHRPNVGISACLLGEAVRYDGGHKRTAWLVEELGPRVTWVPICPEVELGLGVPREPIQLAVRGSGLGVVGVASGEDLTPRFEGWIPRRLDALATLALAGYVFKAGSPSCGVRDVPVADADGRLRSVDAGLFARALRARWPDLPVVEERDLATAEGRRAFEAALFRRAARAREGA